MSDLNSRDVRRCYSAHHPIHAAHYFSPEHDYEYGQLGLSAGPMAYFAGRAAPLGPAPPGLVTALFYNFNARFVAAHLSEAWQRASPATIIERRLVIVDRVLRRLLGPETLASASMHEAARLALEATAGCPPAGRPMYAANADLPHPTEPHLALFHTATLLREFRGDGHIALLTEAGLDGLEALVTDTATGTNWKPHYLQANRGWTADDWLQAQDRLRHRGLLDEAGELTQAGQQLRRDVEAETDRLDAAPYVHLGLDRTHRLTELCGSFSKSLLAQRALPFQHLGK